MIIPGRLLSQPASATRASKRSACITVSTESAISSRLTSDARMPSWPIEMPSLTAIVTNSSGKPPPTRTPSLARCASRASGMLHGVTSFQDEATPDLGLVPVVVAHADGSEHRSRTGARSLPSVTSWLRGFISFAMAASLRCSHDGARRRRLPRSRDPRAGGARVLHADRRAAVRARRHRGRRPSRHSPARRRGRRDHRAR